jgi:hypothetical protein
VDALFPAVRQRRGHLSLPPWKDAEIGVRDVLQLPLPRNADTTVRGRGSRSIC